VQQVEIPGFRKGNAPREVLEQHVGRPRMLEQIKKEFMPIIWSEVIQEQKLQIMGQPTVKIIKEEPLTFGTIVPLKPLVEIIDYHSLRLQPEPMEVTDKDVENVLDNLRRQSATYEAVDRPVEQGDMPTIDIEGIVMESPFITNKSMQFSVRPDFLPEIPGLTDHFIGMKKCEEKDFKHRLPESFSNKLLAGKEVSFKVKVLEVKRENLPALGDTFAENMDVANNDWIDSFDIQVTKDEHYDVITHSL
jgi:trigger factor